MTYFSDEHFRLLGTMVGTKMDRTNPDHVDAYAKLQEAYAATRQWADLLAPRIQPTAKVKVRQRPTNQANNFAGYNWARIYPSENSPETLAYTVGIDGNQSFVVKIDTVQLSDQHPDRIAYRNLAGAYDNSSPIISTLPKADGLKMTLEELVEWSHNEIENFDLTYDEVAQRLELHRLTDEQILKHFEGKQQFRDYLQRWETEDRELFCRLARFAHDQGFDWWHVGKGVQVRFGRKDAKSARALAVVATIQGKTARTLSLRRGLGELAKFKRQPMTEELVSRIEDALSAAAPLDADWLELKEDRPGYWPDQIKPEEEDLVDEDQDEGEVEMKTGGPRNYIFYGPPGTGKTYQVSQLLKQDYEQSAATTTASEWRDRFILDQFGQMNWWEAVAAALYDLGGTATVSSILEHPFVKAVTVTKGRTRNVRQTLWTTLLMKSTKSADEQNKSSNPIFSHSGTGEWKFVGDWEVVCAGIVEVVERLKAGPVTATKIKRHSFVTFHQSYGYEDFVEGLRPLIDESTDGELRYEIKSGVFKSLCDRARQAPDHRFAMVIDEINRGNVSKIFGELITLIEDDKREGEEHAVSVILPYSRDEFAIPRNVDIIGTMNTADRSLALMDTALRRRFEFFAVPPDTRTDEGSPLYDLTVSGAGQSIDVARMLETMNRRIELLYDQDHCIGHAYFTPLQKVPVETRMSELSKIFINRVVPLLEEYFFDDWQKIRLVLGDNQKPPAAQFVMAIRNNEALVEELLGADHGMETILSRPRYERQPGAFDNPSAYLGIYQMLKDQ